MEHVHASHPDIVKRLKRAHGHLAGVIAMIDEGRPCLDLAQQLQAVESAIANAKRTLIEDHMEHCIGDGVADGGKTARAALAEFKATQQQARLDACADAHTAGYVHARLPLDRLGPRGGAPRGAWA